MIGQSVKPAVEDKLDLLIAVGGGRKVVVGVSCMESVLCCLEAEEAVEEEIVDLVGEEAGMTAAVDEEEGVTPRYLSTIEVPPPVLGGGAG